MEDVPLSTISLLAADGPSASFSSLQHNSAPFVPVKVDKVLDKVLDGLIFDMMFVALGWGL